MKFWSERLPFLRDFAGSHRVLHVGPGRESWPGTSIDISAEVRPTVIADLALGHFPFRDDSFDAVFAFSVLEHLKDFFSVVSEMGRVVKPGGFISILTPHFSTASSFVDPSHHLHLAAQSFDYFIAGTPLYETYGFYTNARFRLRHRLVMIEFPWSRVPGLQSLINKRVEFYERHLCFVVRGMGIYVELEVVKQ